MNAVSDLAKLFQDRIEFGAFLVELVNALSKLADLADESGIVLEQPADGISSFSSRSVQLSGFQQVRFEVDSASHNRPYVTRRLEPWHFPDDAQHKA